MKKNQVKDCTITCTTFKRSKTYEAVESKEKPGYAICPVCGEYHKINRK